LAGVTATSLTDSPRVQPQSDVEISPGKYHYCFNLTNLFPTSVLVRKNSENASMDSTDSNTRSPHHMPVPTVPRRAGPPRKKPMKPPIEVPEARVEEAIAAPSVISTADDHKAVETEGEAILAPEHKESKIIDDHWAEIHDEPRSIDSDVQHAEELVVESKSATSGESKEQEPAHDVHSPPPDELKQEHKHEHEHEGKHVGPDHLDRPDDVDTIREDRAEDDYSDEHSDYDEKLSVEHHEHHVGAEPQPYSAIGATGTDEDAEEEEVRRKRVAERLAKMGGINPFAAQTLRLSSEETGHADSSVVSSHASPEGVALPASLSRPDIPTKRVSLPSHEVVEPHPLAVESKVEQEQEEREISDGK
jgi:hypothetical protein